MAATKNSDLIISARQPALQGDSRLFDAYWFRFFEALSRLTAGAQYTTSDVLIDESTNDNGTARVERKTDDALLLGWLNDG